SDTSRKLNPETTNSSGTAINSLRTTTRRSGERDKPPKPLASVGLTRRPVSMASAFTSHTLAGSIGICYAAMAKGSSVGGFVGPGFEGVGEEFKRNFTERGDLGAAFAAFRDGEPIVDLWGGVADRRTARPWGEGTMQCIFSGSKGLVAICMLMLTERG